jgi:hypothetical protein
MKNNKARADLFHWFGFGIVAVIAAVLLFYYTGPTGDIILWVRPLFLNKLHLLREWKWPYFTPAICGGFLLAADPQNPMFTIYQLLSPFFTNQYTVIQVGKFLTTLIFASGMTLWLEEFGIKNLRARIYTAFIIVTSGYWIIQYSIAAIPMDSLSFLPWLFWAAEKLLKHKASRQQVLRWIATVALFSFLLLNIGQHWFQFVFLYIVGRVVAELLFRLLKKPSSPHIIQTIGIFGASVALALLMSSHRIGSIVFYAVMHFPREIGITQIFGSIRYELVVLARALFDSRIITQHLTDKHLGGWWEWTAYLSIFSLVPIAIGLSKIKSFKNKICFAGMGITVILQLLFCRYGELVEAYRRYVPGVKNMSWYFRGRILVVYLLAVLIAKGFEVLLSGPKKYSRILAALAVLLCVGSVSEQLFTYYRGEVLGVGDWRYKTSDFKYPEKLTAFETSEKILEKREIYHLSQGVGEAGCYDPPLLGYKNEYFKSQVKAGPIETPANDRYANISDVPKIFGPSGLGGYYKSVAWPRWPKSDRDGLNRFLEFRQVTEPPFLLKVLSAMSMLGFLIFIGLWTKVVLDWKKRRTH